MPKFVRNLEKIYDYIFGDLFAPNAADKILEKVDKEIERLENSPFIHVKIEKVNEQREEEKKQELAKEFEEEEGERTPWGDAYRRMSRNH